MMPPGAEPLPEGAAFRLDPPPPAMTYQPPERVRGVLLGCFGMGEEPTHVVVVNLDYGAELTTTLAGPGRLEPYDTTTRRWSAADGDRVELRLPPGGGKLLRLAR
jgi:hypothetical protein